MTGLARKRQAIGELVPRLLLTTVIFEGIGILVNRKDNSSRVVGYRLSVQEVCCHVGLAQGSGMFTGFPFTSWTDM